MKAIKLWILQLNIWFTSGRVGVGSHTALLLQSSLTPGSTHSSKCGIFPGIPRVTSWWHIYVQSMSWLNDCFLAWHKTVGLERLKTLTSSEFEHIGVCFFASSHTYKVFGIPFIYFGSKKVQFEKGYRHLKRLFDSKQQRHFLNERLISAAIIRKAKINSFQISTEEIAPAFIRALSGFTDRQHISLI